MPSIHAKLTVEMRDEMDAFHERMGSSDAEVVRHAIAYAREHDVVPERINGNIPVNTTIPEELRTDIETEADQHGCNIQQTVNTYVYHSVVENFIDFMGYFASETVDDDFIEEHRGGSSISDESSMNLPEDDDLASSREEGIEQIKDDIDQL